MQFSIFAAATALMGFASAAPAPQIDPDTYENIDIAEFSVRKTEAGEVTNVSFKLSGKDAQGLVCSASNPGLPSEVITCGETKYRFALIPGETYEYGLRIYHELGTAFGYYGSGEIFTYCHAGGLGELACNQQADNFVTIVINGA